MPSHRQYPSVSNSILSVSPFVSVLAPMETREHGQREREREGGRMRRLRGRGSKRGQMLSGEAWHEVCITSWGIETFDWQ